MAFTPLHNHAQQVTGPEGYAPYGREYRNYGTKRKTGSVRQKLRNPHGIGQGGASHVLAGAPSILVGNSDEK
jgi:hypothetical protein